MGSRRAASVSRMSSLRVTREGTELMAPGWTAQVPTVATVSMASGGEGVVFDGEDEFGGGAEGVAAVGHEEGAGVAAEAGDGVAVAGGGGDVGDDADGDVFAFEERALLDVELYPGVVVVGREVDGGEGAGEAGGGADLVEGWISFRCASWRASALVGSRVPPRRREPMQPMPKRVGSSEVNMRSSMERRGWRPML